MVKLHGLVFYGDGHPTIDTDLDAHFFRILIVGWMTIKHIPCFDSGTYAGFGRFWASSPLLFGGDGDFMDLPSGKHTKNIKKSRFCKSTIYTIKNDCKWPFSMANW